MNTKVKSIIKAAVFYLFFLVPGLFLFWFFTPSVLAEYSGDTTNLYLHSDNYKVNISNDTWTSISYNSKACNINYMQPALYDTVVTCIKSKLIDVGVAPSSPEL